VLNQLRVARPAIQRSDAEGRPFVEASLERVDLLDGDVIVQFGSDAEGALARTGGHGVVGHPALSGGALILLAVRGNAEERELLEGGLAAKPLYAGLPAVQSGRVHVIDRGVANGLGGIWAYQRIVADLRGFLAA
jgi:ABC-type Fe3+-hydroxamate transport system substrate-binding protein